MGVVDSRACRLRHQRRQVQSLAFLLISSFFLLLKHVKTNLRPRPVLSHDSSDPIRPWRMLLRMTQLFICDAQYNSPPVFGRALIAKAQNHVLCLVPESTGSSSQTKDAD
jgi:hypothetical protein